MANRVAVIGTSQTKHEAAKRGDNLEDIIFEAARGALCDAELEIGDIDSVVLAAHDQIDGRSSTAGNGSSRRTLSVGSRDRRGARSQWDVRPVKLRGDFRQVEKEATWVGEWPS